MSDTLEIVSCDRFGNNQRTHPYAIQDDQGVHRELVGDDSFSFTVPITDEAYAAGLLEPVRREIQVYRHPQGGQPRLYWWGVITRSKEVGRSIVEVEVSGLEWHFTGLHIGKAQRTNWIPNGSFDAGLGPWIPVGVTTNIVTEWGGRPAQTFQLNLYQGGQGLDTFVYQSIPVPPGYWLLDASFHIRTDAQWVGPALDGRGLFVERLAADNVTVEESKFFAIDDNTERGTFQNANVNIHTPEGRTSYLRIRLYATRCTNPTPTSPRPPGGIIWDDVRLTRMESNSYPLTDVGTIFNELVQHAQDPAFDKTNLNITAVTPPTGVNVERYYQHAEHVRISDAFKDFADEGVCDFGFSYPSPTQRSFRAYVPRMGQFRSNVVLTLNGVDGLTGIPTVEKDGGRTVTVAIALAEGQTGPGRSEAAAIDTSSTDGVIREETFETAEHHDRLALAAQEFLRSKKNLAEVPQVEVDASILERVDMGDIIGISVPAPAPFDANYRIVAIEGPSGNKVTLTLNVDA